MDLLQFREMVPNENAAREFVHQVRWPNGIKCPRCSGLDVVWLDSYKRWRCRNLRCQQRFSIRTNTLFENSNIPLRKWLIGMFAFMSDHRGVSSVRLARMIDVTQPSAHRQLHRIRKAYEVDRRTLTGPVGISEVRLDGRKRNRHFSNRYFPLWTASQPDFETHQTGCAECRSWRWLQRTLTADWDGVRLGEGGNGVAQPDDGRTLEFAADAGALHSQRDRRPRCGGAILQRLSTGALKCVGERRKKLF